MVVREHVCGVELDKAGVEPRSKVGDKGSSHGHVKNFSGLCITFNRRYSIVYL